MSDDLTRHPLYTLQSSVSKIRDLQTRLNRALAALEITDAAMERATAAAIKAHWPQEFSCSKRAGGVVYPRSFGGSTRGTGR